MMIIIAMKLLLPVCFGSLATGFSNLRITQTPTNINLSVGDCTEITCLWEEATERYRANWCFVSKENITKNISAKVLYLSNITHENKDVFVIKSATVNDTGFYYCEITIEIPSIKKLRGNGTTVIVEEKDTVAEAHSLERRYLETLAILAFLVAMGGLYLCYRKKQHSTLSAGPGLLRLLELTEGIRGTALSSGAAQLPVLTGQQEQEQMVEMEEFHGRNESTREAAEENSSCNSVEWAVSTLYESSETFCDESRGKYDKSTATIVSNGADEQIPQTRAAEKSRMRQGSAIYSYIQN